MSEIFNARIRSTMLGYEDNGVFTAILHLVSDGWGYEWGCGFGGIALDDFDRAKGKRVGTGFGIDFMAGVLNTVGVSTWEELPGQKVRIEMEPRRIVRIGHITKDVWFDGGRSHAGLANT